MLVGLRYITLCVLIVRATTVLMCASKSFCWLYIMKCFHLQCSVCFLSVQKENIGDLLIVKAQLSQAGIFTCTAQTVVDSASSSAKLLVRGKMGLSAQTVFLQQLLLEETKAMVIFFNKTEKMKMC